MNFPEPSASPFPVAGAQLIWKLRLRAALWIALCAGCFYQSSFALLPLLVSEEGRSSYAERRIRNAFAGLRLDQVERSLDRRLPREQPVALGPELAGDEFVSQRFAEALFPRLIDPQAAYVLGKAGSPLAALSPGKELLLAGHATPALVPALIPKPSAADEGALVTLARVLATMLALAALGWWILPAPAESLLAAAAVAGVAQIFANLFQLPVFPSLIPLAGFPALALHFTFRRAHPLKRPGNDTLAFLALLSALILIPLFFPSLKWDWRSIWLLHAKTLFFYGFIPKALALNAGYQWSHFDYPPLFAAWMGAFSSGVSFSERSAQTAATALAAALSVSLWRLARESLGKTEGALLTVAITLGVSPLFTGGLADGTLLLCLLVARLALLKKETRLGVMALLAASLMKSEGIVLGAFVLLSTAPRSRAWLAFLPALVMIAWAKSVGIQANADGIEWAQLPSGAASRFLPILSSAFEIGLRSFLLAGGFAALLYAIVRAPRAPSTQLAVLGFAFALGVFVVTPLNFAWHISTAMGRLLIYGAGFALLAAAELNPGARRKA